MSDSLEQVPFNRTVLVGRELDYIRQAVEAMQISGDGIFTRKCSTLLERELGVQRALLTPSCTAALEMAALLLELKPGDEVIVPAFSFVSTVNAFALRGARIVFADVRPDTLNLDASLLDRLVGPRTRAIVLVHYGGVGCEMEPILEIAARHDLPIVEDNAHGLFARYRGRLLGTFGCLSTLSFHETKNLGCGKGGALIIGDPRYVARAETLRDKGTDRQKMLRGEVDKYTWVDLGSSYALCDLLAAFLYAQLEQRARIAARRRELWAYYDSSLRDWIGDHEVQLPQVPADCEASYHVYYLVLPSDELRPALIEHLRRGGVLSASHYTPLHLSRMGRAHGAAPGGCPVTERVSARLVRLPLYHDLSTAQQDRVLDGIREFFEER